MRNASPVLSRIPGTITLSHHDIGCRSHLAASRSTRGRATVFQATAPKTPSFVDLISSVMPIRYRRLLPASVECIISYRRPRHARCVPRIVEILDFRHRYGSHLGVIAPSARATSCRQIIPVNALCLAQPRPGVPGCFILMHPNSLVVRIFRLGPCSVVR